MAIQKAITDERGVTATYYRIAAIIGQYQTDVPIITVQMMGYADATYRDREKLGDGQSLFITFKEIYLAADDAIGYTRADIYKRLTTEIDEFVSAKEI